MLVHQYLADISHTPELAFKEHEARELREALQRVLRHYTPDVAQKRLDQIALGSTLVSLYGSRAYLIADRRARERELQPATPMPAAGIAVTEEAVPQPNGAARPSFPGLDL